MTTKALKTTTPGILKGPAQNYGLFAAPTPGFGYEWKRSIEEEQWSQQKDKDLPYLEKFDRYEK